MLTQERLKEVLDYDPDTGVFTYKKSRGCRSKGSVAGFYSNGYILIKIEGKQYQAHRLAFLFMKGRFPVNDVDHINRIKDDNSWKNLRDVTRAVNSMNTGINRNNLLGKSNIRVLKDTGKYQVRVRGVSKGCYDTLEQAEECYNNVEDARC